MHGHRMSRVYSQKVLLMVEVRQWLHHRPVSLSGRFPAAAGCCSACISGRSAWFAEEATDGGVPAVGLRTAVKAVVGVAMIAKPRWYCS